MEMNSAIVAVELFLKKFGEALNTADVKAIFNAYSREGQYHPPALPDVWMPEVVKERAELFFRSKSMTISFDVKSVTIQNDFAFLHAHATSEIISKINGVRNNFKSKDFFVLKSEAGDWKIFRYIFETITLP